jgi:hypothetical protein
MVDARQASRSGRHMFKPACAALIEGKEAIMLLRTHDASLELRKGQVVSLSDAKGLEIRVTRGTLWITQENDERDRVLKAGDHHFVGSAGLTVLSALNGSAVLVATQRQRPGPRRLVASALHLFRASMRPARLRNHPIATLHAA